MKFLIVKTACRICLIGAGFCFFLLALITPSPYSEAAPVTITVDPGESIQDAIDNLPAEGGIVRLSAGVHDVYVPIIINQSNVTIQGTHDSVIMAHDEHRDIFSIPHECVGRPNNNSCTTHDWENMPILENLVFEGFKVSSSFTETDYLLRPALIEAWQVKNITVEDIYNDSHLSYFVAINPSSSTTAARSYDITIHNNVVLYSRTAWYWSENIYCLSNTIGRGKNAIIHSDRNNRNINIIGNYVDSTGGRNGCMVLDASDGFEVYDNVVIGNEYGIKTQGPRNANVRNNIVMETDKAGIWLYEQGAIENTIFCNNRIYNNRAHGVLVDELGHNMRDGKVTFKNNIIHNNAEDGIRFQTVYIECDISSNIITNNSGYGINNIITSENTTHNYNNVWGNTLGSYNGTSAGTGDISLNPLFVVSANGDFHLKSTAGRWTESGWVTDIETSPCIDAGDLADDYSNEPEPNGDRINMGTYGNTIEASKSPGAVYGTVEGTVTDDDTGNPVEEATVTVVGTGFSAQTASDGTYTISNVPVGTRAVTCTKAGYKDASEINVMVTEDTTTTVDFELTQKEPDTTPPEITLKTITVNGSVDDDTVTEVEINGTSVTVTTGAYSHEVDVTSTKTITIIATNGDNKTVTRTINVK